MADSAGSQARRVKNQNSFCFVISSRATLNETLTAKRKFCPEHLSKTKIRIYTPKRDDEHPRPFDMRSPPPPPPRGILQSSVWGGQVLQVSVRDGTPNPRNKFVGNKAVLSNFSSTAKAGPEHSSKCC